MRLLRTIHLLVQVQERLAIIFKLGFWLLNWFPFIFVPNLSLLVDVQKSIFKHVYHVGMGGKLAIDVIDGLVEFVKLILVDIRCQLGFSFFLLFNLQQPCLVSSLLPSSFLLLVNFFLVAFLHPTFLNELLDDLLKGWFIPILFNLKPSCHDSILQLYGKFSPISFLVVVMGQFATLVFVVVLVTVWVTNDVVKGRLHPLWVKQDSFLVLQCNI